MNRQLLDALEACLQAMEKGESMESALKRFPRFASDLRPLLETAWAARTLRQSEIPGRVAARGRSRLLAAAAALRARNAASPRLKPSWRYALTVLAVVAFLVLSGNGLLVASARSLPGDMLYPVKRSMETTQLNLVANPGQKQALQQQFSQRRVEETKSLITIKRVILVDFDGMVSDQTQDGWVVSGIPVVVNAQTQVIGQIIIGQETEVSGMTQSNGWVLASRMKADESGGENEPGSGKSSSPTEAVNQGEDSGSTPEGTGTPATGDWQEQHTRPPEPTDGHPQDSTEVSSLGPTEGHDYHQSVTPTPEPTDVHGSEWWSQQTPQPTWEHSKEH
jgi:hypothetical protein